jgi:hypothetical protein
VDPTTPRAPEPAEPPAPEPTADPPAPPPEPEPAPAPRPEPPPAAATVLQGRWTEANADLAARLEAAERRAREAEERARRAETLAAEHERRLQSLTADPAESDPRRRPQAKRDWLLGDWLAD